MQPTPNSADKSQVCSLHSRLSVALMPIHINLTAISGFAVGSPVAGIFPVVVLWDCRPTVMGAEQSRKQISGSLKSFGNLLNATHTHTRTHTLLHAKLPTLLFAWRTVISMQLMTQSECPLNHFWGSCKMLDHYHCCLTVHYRKCFNCESATVSKSARDSDTLWVVLTLLNCMPNLKANSAQDFFKSLRRHRCPAPYVNVISCMTTR